MSVINKLFQGLKPDTLEGTVVRVQLADSKDGSSQRFSDTKNHVDLNYDGTASLRGGVYRVTTYDSKTHTYKTHTHARPDNSPL